MTDHPTRVGVVGLGQIGGGIARCLHRAGHAVIVHDLRMSAMEELRGVAEIASSLPDLAARADVVIVAVASAEQARAVLLGAGGIYASARPGTIFVLVCTIAVSEVRDLAARAEARDLELVDCGVTGGVRAASAAADGDLVCLVGGAEMLVQRVRPVLEDMSKLVLHVGPTGAGMAAKIARNVITYGSWRAAHEARLLAAHADVDLSALVAAVRASDPVNEITCAWLERLTDRHLADPLLEPSLDLRRLAAGHMEKDLDAALKLARAFGLELPLTEIAHGSAADVLGTAARTTS